MADNKKKRGSPDSKTVALGQQYEVDYLKQKFNVSGQQVAGAVRAVGKSRKKVEEYLKNVKKK